MSIAAVTAYAELKAGTDRKPAGTNTDDSRVQKELARITAFVPTEAIATYVGVLGITTPKSELWRWILLVVMAVVAVFLCWYYWSGSTTSLPRKALWLSMGFALVGLGAWASALPSSPFFSIPGYTTVIGGIVVIVLSPIIPRIAERLGVAPPREGN